MSDTEDHVVAVQQFSSRKVPVGRDRRSQLGSVGECEILGLDFQRTLEPTCDVTVLAATGLVLVVDLGPKALFGVVGAAAVVIGVTHLLAALTLRHEDRRGRAPAGTA